MTKKVAGSATAAHAAGDARLAAFLSPRGWQFGVLGAAFTLLAAGGALVTHLISISRDGVIPNMIDFRVFWGAGRLAVEGTPLASFDMTQLAGTAGLAADHYLPWLYPPAMLMAVTPLGLMSFSMAWVVFTLLSVLAFALAIRPFTAGVLPVWLGFGLAPACLPALLLGQNTLLWVAGLLAALAALRSDRAVLAGVLIGLLTIKPQAGLLIPFALLGIGAWRTILAACATTVLLAGLPTLVYGPAYWSTMIEAAGLQADLVFGQAANITLLSSPFSLLAGFGVPLGSAMAVQWAMTALCALFVLSVWRARISDDLKAAALFCAIPLALPYFWYYDAVFLAVAALFLFRAGALRPQLPDLGLLVLLWLGAAPVSIGRLVGGTSEVSARILVVPVALAALVLCLSVVMRRAAPTPEPNV